MARPKKEEVTFVLPSNPKDVQSIRDAIFEIEGALTFIKDKKEYIKDTYTALDEKYHMPKELVSKLVKAHQDDKFDEMVAKNEEFEITYEKVMSFGATMESDETDPYQDE